MSLPRRRRPRGRTALLWAAAVFAGVQLAAGVLFDYGWPQLRFPLLYEHVDRVAGLAPPANVVFLGSSRTQSSIDEAEVSAVARAVSGDAAVRTAGASVPAGDPVLQEIMLHHLLQRGVRPRYAVIEISPEQVNHHNRWVAIYGPWVLCWHDVPAFADDLARCNSLPRFAGTQLLPLYVYRESVRLRVAALARSLTCPAPPAPPPPAPAVTAPRLPGAEAARWRRRIDDALRDVPAGPNPRTALGLNTVPRELADYRPGGTAAAALERLLTTCREHGIEPILVSMPVSAPHRACYTPRIEAAFGAYVQRLTRQFGCRYADYSAALPDALFMDHHHVASDGQAIFSRRIGLELIAPTWTGSGGS